MFSRKALRRGVSDKLLAENRQLCRRNGLIKGKHAETGAEQNEPKRRLSRWLRLKAFFTGKKLSQKARSEPVHGRQYQGINDGTGEIAKDIIALNHKGTKSTKKIFSLPSDTPRLIGPGRAGEALRENMGKKIATEADTQKRKKRFLCVFVTLWLKLS